MSWDSLKNIIREAADIESSDASGTPSTCPNDYTTLKAGPDGKLYCPWDGLVWPDESEAWGPYPGAY